MSRSLILVFVLYISSVLAGDFKEDEGVLVLTKNDFDGALEEFKYILVEFCKYANMLAGFFI